MYNFIFIQYLFQSICFLVFQESITANNSDCNTLRLNPSQPLVVSIFSHDDGLDYLTWDQMCAAIMKLPKGLVKMDYRPGTLATGSVNNINCGSTGCKKDQIDACTIIKSRDYNDCYTGVEASMADISRCYCNQGANKLLLDNAALRKSWNVPRNPIPALAMNKVYDPCVKFRTTKEFLSYFVSNLPESSNWVQLNKRRRSSNTRSIFL